MTTISATVSNSEMLVNFAKAVEELDVKAKIQDLLRHVPTDRRRDVLLQLVADDMMQEAGAIRTDIPAREGEDSSINERPTLSPSSAHPDAPIKNGAPNRPAMFAELAKAISRTDPPTATTRERQKDLLLSVISPEKQWKQIVLEAFGRDDDALRKRARKLVNELKEEGRVLQLHGWKYQLL